LKPAVASAKTEDDGDGVDEELLLLAGVRAGPRNWKT